MVLLSDHTLFSKPNPSKHVIIMYNDYNLLIDVVIKFLNIGLKRGQLCIFGTVNVNEEITKKLSSGITDYEENIQKKNLLMIPLKQIYSKVLEHDLTPFEELKKTVLDNVKKRSDKHIRLVGDLGGFMFEQKHFDECILLEEWFQKNPLRGTCVCPYNNSIFEESPYKEMKDKVLHTHDILICS